MDVVKVKVKLWGAYRLCQLLRVHPDGAVDVRVWGGYLVSGMPSVWNRVPLGNVRKADRHLCVIREGNKPC